MDNRYYDELAKCASSFEHFCNNYVKVKDYFVDADNKVVGERKQRPLKLHDFQKRYISHLQGNRFSIATKFRQGGFSTITTAYLLWKFLFEKNLNLMVVSRTDREARAIGDKFKEMHGLLPEWLQTVFQINNDHEKKSVETGCRIIFRTPAATRGCSVDILFIDEAAFIKDMDTHWKAMYPCVANKGRVIVVSSTNGTNGWFYEVYQKAKDGIIDFKAFRAEYTEYYEWDEAKLAEVKSNLGDLGFRQEVLQEFLPTGELFICDTPNAEKEILKDMGGDTSHVPEWKDDDEMAAFREKHFKDESKIQDDLQKRFPNIKPGCDIKHVENKNPQLLFECELSGGCRENEPEGVRAKMKKIDEIDLRKNTGYSFKCANMNDIAKVFPHEASKPSGKLNHPHMNEEFDMSSKNLAEVFEGLSQGDDSFKEAAKYWRNCHEHWERKQEEVEAKVHGVFPADLLRMAGVISQKEAKEIEQTSSTGKVDILQAILEDSGFPKSLNLSFGDYLEVNGVPTLISTNSVKNTYMGLTALWDHDRSVKFVSDILKEKLDTLFGFGKG